MDIYETKDLGMFVKKNCGLINKFITNYCATCGFYLSPEDHEDVYQQVCQILHYHKALSKYKPSKNNTYYTYIRVVLNNAISMVVHRGGQAEIDFKTNKVPADENIKSKDIYEDIDNKIDYDKFRMWLHKEFDINLEIIDSLLKGYNSTEISKMMSQTYRVVQYFRMIIGKKYKDFNKD